MVVILILFLPVSGLAQESENGWGFSVRPFVYVPQASGDVKFNSIIQGSLKGKFEVGAGFYLEAQKKKWSIASDFIFLNYSTQFTAPISSRSGDYKGKYTVGSIFGLYSFTPWLSVGLGMKLTILDSKLTIPRQGALPEVNESFKYWLFPPLIAMRVKILDGDKTKLGVQGEYGGFGVFGMNSYFINPFVTYRFSDLISASATYRILSIEREEKDSNTQLDLLFNGPQLVFGIHF